VEVEYAGSRGREGKERRIRQGPETKWYKDTKAAWHPGITLRIRRENAGLTQARLAQLAGLTVSNISAMENGRRPIGLAVAKRLAAALDRSVSDFVEPYK
jgi:DNA-binding XRE family transcriptional regulator